jgi:hypothetical protein
VGLRAHAASVARTCTKAGAQHDGAGRMSGDDFSSPPLRKTASDMLALKPYLGENSPYGILEGTMETSASFEARSAPSPYSTTLIGTNRYNLSPRIVRFARVLDELLHTGRLERPIGDDRLTV